MPYPANAPDLFLSQHKLIFPVFIVKSTQGIKSSYRLAWPRTPAFQAENPGSNPGGSTKIMETLPSPESKFYKYTYVNKLDNNRLVFECVAKDILEADKNYEKATGKDPKKQNNIACSLEPAEEIEENIEASPKKDQISFEELQSAINDPNLDLPELRRDISKEENISWLLRNILIRNSDKISEVYYKSLGALLKK